MASSPIRYAISLPQPATHLVNVRVDLEAPPRNVALRFPTWIPGSYLIREFARHVQGFQAFDKQGRELRWRKTRKDVWQIENDGAGPVRVEYDVYANELTVRTSHVDATHAFINPANVLPFVTGLTDQPLPVTLDLPSGWKVCTGLQEEERNRRYVARDFDELVDGPIHASADQIIPFEVDGIPHEIATWGRGNLDPARLSSDVARIVHTEAQLFGELPYERYAFILMLTDGARGGLEHRNSSALLVSRWDFRSGRPYERTLQLFAHEFFHTWNVKRIHPEALGPFDYGNEAYTRLLWAMEGITDYYTSLFLRRAGLVSAERYLEILGEQISEIAETPGRHLQSLEEASFDAWIKYYRPDEHSVNSAISYYRKGALAALLLDLELRRRTAGQRTLDDLMRHLWANYALQNRGVPEDGYERAVAELTGEDWTPFFDHAIRGREELDFGPGLEAVGLQLEWRGDSGAPEAWLGIRTRTDAGRTRIAAVLSDGPAWGSGLSGGDELLALDGIRIEEASLNDRLRDYRPGDTVRLAIFQRDELREVSVTLARRPATRASLRKLPHASVRQREAYERWIGAAWDRS